ncbi:unnamed protein product [Spirodela intermedia]|uniref:Uncharacterized protein n=1 Tax=Spirodela intermedia TaxID=51605 RepID=A0A7I8KX27_SPIIN|nr:unnamed protein product [Spirodela intermedia]
MVTSTVSSDRRHLVVTAYQLFADWNVARRRCGGGLWTGDPPTLHSSPAGRKTSRTRCGQHCGCCWVIVVVVVSAPPDRPAGLTSSLTHLGPGLSSVDYLTNDRYFLRTFIM